MSAVVNHIIPAVSAPSTTLRVTVLVSANTKRYRAIRTAAFSLTWRAFVLVAVWLVLYLIASVAGDRVSVFVAGNLCGAALVGMWKRRHDA